MLNIKFRYRDELSHGEWREQHCTVSSIEKCKELYGLGTDLKEEDYEIIEVVSVNHDAEERGL